MTITLSILLIPYGLFLFFWAVFSYTALFHMVKYGFKTPVTYLMLGLFSGVSLFLLIISFLFLVPVDWGREITLF